MVETAASQYDHDRLSVIITLPWTRRFWCWHFFRDLLACTWCEPSHYDVVRHSSIDDACSTGHAIHCDRIDVYSPTPVDPLYQSANDKHANYYYYLFIYSSSIIISYLREKCSRLTNCNFVRWIYYLLNSNEFVDILRSINDIAIGR